MKEAKKQYYNTEILNCLIDGDVVSTQQIADAVGMSEKSIRNKIFDINEYLQENDMGIIQKKPRVGMWLECSEEQKQKLQSVLMNRNTVVVKDDDNDRVMELLKIFFKLRPWETITTQRLTEELYLSAPTVLKIIRECEKWLAPYKVKIANEKNRGYRLDCNENEYRVAMKDFIMSDFDNEKIKSNMDYFFYNMDTKLVQKSIIETENVIDLPMSHSMKSLFIVVLHISVERLNRQRLKIEEKFKFFKNTMNIHSRWQYLRSYRKNYMYSFQMKKCYF